MRILLQRVQKASVSVENSVVGEIGAGLLLFLGLCHGDTLEKGKELFEKVVNLRIFPGESGKIDKSLLDISGDVLLVSQFTLYANTSKGRRPSFTDAMHPAEAEKLYNDLIVYGRERLGALETGAFGALMEVSLINDGPFTLMLNAD
tara:strand:- start:25 stop:465 length:441 start_codon:yes stop_codon:yes gene_type:complete